MRKLALSFVIAVWILGAATTAGAAAPVRELTFTLQTRDPQTGEPKQQELKIPANKMAVVLVDVWTSHPCIGATSWPAKMIPAWNRALDACRALGIPVIFASAGDDLKRWEGKPQRERIKALPHHPLPPSNGFLKGHGVEGPWGVQCMCPIHKLKPGTDQPLFECHAQGHDPNQDPRIAVKEQDYFIAAGHYRPGIQWAIDSWGEPAQQELWNFVQEKGITHLIYMGDATNMCVINREFGMIQARRLGLTAIIARDLTNAMTYYGYNPVTKQLDPSITPAVGTAKAVEYIEKKIGPSIGSGELFEQATAMKKVKASWGSPLFSAAEVKAYKPTGASNSYRQLCLDFNWQGAEVDDYFVKSDPVEIAEFSQKINLDGVLLLAVPSEGYCTYETEIGQKFPSMKGDWLGQTIKELHRRNIAALCYITLGFDRKWADANPEYASKTLPYGDSFDGWICLNSPHTELIAQYSQEVLRKYPVDSLRYDVSGQPPDCYCPGCKKYYKELYGEEMPAQWTAENWRRQCDFRRASSTRAFKKLYEACKAVKPEIEVWQNGFMNDEPRDANDLDAGRRFQDMAYIESGSPFNQLFQDGVLRPRATIVGHIIEGPRRRLCVALGARCYSPFAVNRQTALPNDRKWFFNDLAPFYAMVREIQPLLAGARPVWYAGVVYCEATRYRWEKYDRSRYIALCQRMTDSYLKRSLPLRFINNLDLPTEDLTQYKVLVLALTSGLRQQDLAALRRYVKNGGKLLIAGDSLRHDEKGGPLGDFALAREMGLQFTGETKVGADATIRQAAWSGAALSEKIKPAVLVEVKPLQGRTLLALEQEGAAHPLLHVNSLGRGQVAYLATTDSESLLELVTDWLAGVLPVTIEPADKQAILTRQEKEGRWVLHVLSEGDYTIEIDKNYAAPVKIVSQYPSEGWQATAEPTPRGLRIKVSGAVKNRLVVLN